LQQILRLLYEGFNRNEGKFAKCLLLIKEQLYSVEYFYQLSEKSGFKVCSQPDIIRVFEESCMNGPEMIRSAYLHAIENGYYFYHEADSGSIGMNPFKVPRFSEDDFREIIEKLHGNKIDESTTKTPDFLVGQIAIELKDLQTESLFDKDRQVSIGKIFKQYPGKFVDLYPLLNYGELTAPFHTLIQNTVKNHIKKASKQIKALKETQTISNAGIILLNTGMFTLPHELLKSFVQGILDNNTRTIEFAFIFSQRMQTNGFDTYAVFPSGFIGRVPDEIRILESETDKMVEAKMTQLMQDLLNVNAIVSMHPISFLQNGKIFYWHPGKIMGGMTKHFERD